MISVVVDTNIWISALSSKSENHWFVQAFLDEKFSLVVSTGILAEYEEKLKEKYAQSVAEDFLETLDIAAHVIKTEPYFL